MKKFARLNHCALAVAALLMHVGHANAQSAYSNGQNSAFETNRESWLPYTTSGYVGISGGNAEIDGPCVAGQVCEDPDSAFQVYIGGKFSPYFGIQLGYLQLADAERNGGKTEVKGLNLVLTGTIPLGTSFSVNGRAGGTYGWTKTSVGTGVLAASGDEDGFGPSYGVGVSWDFNRNWSLSLDWDRHQLKYIGGAKNDTDITALGIKYRF